MIKNKNAFTLVEILIVVSIVALLSAIAIPNLLRARLEAQEASAQANLKLIANAMENYAAINAMYPTATTSLMGVTPPYLSTDYFNGTFAGYTFVPTLTNFSYLVTAYPPSAAGIASFTISTGAVLTRY